MRHTIGLVFIVLAAAAGGCTRERPSDRVLSQELNVYNWANYIGETTIADFEREFNVKVHYDNFSSNDELLAKLQAGVSGYDVIVPADYMVKILISQSLLAELDTSVITNIRNIDQRFRGLSFDPQNRFSIPYQWGTTGFGVNIRKVKQEATSWSILWDERLSGRITVLDEARSGIIPALKMLGYSSNTTDPGQLEAAKGLMLKQKKIVKAYTSNTYMDLLRSGDVWVACGFSGDIYQVTKTNPDIRYVIPKEGTDMWVDNLAIPVHAPHKYTAEVFINYLLRPEVAAAIASETWYATANKEARKLLDKKLLNDPGIYPPPEVLDKCEFLEDVGLATRDYDRVWNEIKAGGN